MSDRRAAGPAEVTHLQTVSWPRSYGEDAKPRMGFFTDTSVCIGCKACEVACKEWNQIPMSIKGFTGKSYDNTVALGANTWRHVAFVEQRVPADAREDPGSLVQIAERNGAIEAGVCVLAMENSTLPPTINLERQDPNCDLDYVPLVARKANIDVAMSNSMGLGGHNASLVLRKVTQTSGNGNGHSLAPASLS